jgi:TPR repeat protein
MMYLTGTGLERNSSEAAKWFHKAADAQLEENHEASYNLGLMYFHGDGVERDSQKAAQYFGLGTWKKFHAGSMNYLAMLYFCGDGVERDEFRALELLNEAAKLGDRDAQYNLGTLYRKDEIDEQDFKNAPEWFCRGGIDEQGFKAALKWICRGMEQ